MSVKINLFSETQLVAPSPIVHKQTKANGAHGDERRLAMGEEAKFQTQDKGSEYNHLQQESVFLHIMDPQTQQRHL